MTATMQSAYCKATTTKSNYAPYPDWVEINIDITNKSWYASCKWVVIQITYDGSTVTTTGSSMDGTGKLTWYHAPSDPGDNNLHNYYYTLKYYNNSSLGTLYGSESVYNYYNLSSTAYYMQGRMGSFRVNETLYEQTVTYLTPNNGYVNWRLKPYMNSSYPAIDVARNYTFTYNGGGTLSYNESRAKDYLGWSAWDISREYRNQLYGRVCGVFKLSYTFTYYNGTKDGTGQYIPQTYSVSNAHTFTVYENVTRPLLDIKEVYSSNINDETQQTVLDPAPYEGKAPYKVTWTAAANTTEHPYALPITKIVWNFGDPDSGGSNQATTTSYATTQTHTYPDYDSRTCTITVTDIMNNVNSTTARFSPSTKQRQFKAPTLAPLEGDQPLLCIGNTDLAGSPEPKPEWKFVRVATPEYTGTVTGKYVEISLLKAGMYYVYYTVSLEGSTYSKRFIVNIDAITPTPDDSQDMHDFDLIVLDSAGNPVDWCKQHNSIQYIEYYQDLDVFSFEIPKTYEYAKYLQEGNYLILGYKGKARLMQVTYRGRNGNTITISGESAFPVRVAITATRSTANDGYDVQSYKGESLVRYFIQSCLKDPYGSEPRSADFVCFGADGEKGGSVTYSARYEQLRDIVNEVCKSANIGYTICARQSGLLKAGLTVTQGTDRTYTSGGSDMVVFSPERLKNCVIESDQGSMASNVGIGAGEGIGSIREYSYYGDKTKTGFERREMFCDAGDSADDDEVKRMTELALKEEQQMSIRIRVLPTCQWNFGADTNGYNVGDVVTLESPDRGSLDLQIYSAEKCRRATGDELYLNLGYECASAPTLIRRTAKENTYARK